MTFRLLCLAFTISHAQANEGSGRDQARAFGGAPAPLLLAAVTPGESIIIGTLVVGLTALLGLLGKWRSERESIVQQAVAGAIAAQQPVKREISGQPVRFTSEHPCVEQPDFDRHTEEIWRVVNGLRLSLSRIETNAASEHATRKANGELLKELSGESKRTGNEVAALSALLKQHLKEHHS